MSFLHVLQTSLNIQKSCLINLSKCLLNFNTNPETSLFGQTLISVRFHRRNQRIFRKIRGGGRPVPPGVVPPEPSKYGWRPVYPEDGKYTIKPLPIIKMGGRHPETGRVVVRTIGGGHKKRFRWVDYKREGPEDGTTLEEKVFQVRYDPCRTARIALVASGDHKRWILASENMKVGDVIKTSAVIPRIPIRPVEGDAHPIGALPQGTLVHSIEAEPGSGGKFCRAAGSSAQFLRKLDNKCLVQLPSKRQILIHEKCMVVVGRVSNINHGSIPIGSPNRLRWLGKRPVSGLWHRKDGYCGRKIHPPKPILDLLAEREEKPEIFQFTFKK
ncbi:39S ribosomal protein L2, mitochondrial-like [Uloborus diversus]|uniref:39S ribosomal protein L2, mitochondrial-like n=1 Tax=Uloborus diversus TaxID=327109 RepID=UPI002409AD3B|nr:39S ribosomal protein L2, mitochondrial-like [Uloborus diversus]